MFFSFILVYSQPFHTSIKMKLVMQLTFVLYSSKKYLISQIYKKAVKNNFGKLCFFRTCFCAYGLNNYFFLKRTEHCFYFL